MTADNATAGTTERLSVTIRRATSADLSTVAGIHTRAFPGFVLTQLGEGFLRRYYRAVMDYPRGVLLVADAGGMVVGIAAGFADPAAFSRSLKRRILALAPHILVGVLTHPQVFGIVWQTSLGVLRGRLQVAAPADDEGTMAIPEGDSPDEFEFCSLGVHPSAQGLGIGKALTRGIIGEARRLGAAGIYLNTDADDNDYVNRFYAALGFELQGWYMATGKRRRNRYRMSLADPEQS
jgi:ribosomal protein S18 acetylase RimI-like enzyme